VAGTAAAGGAVFYPGLPSHPQYALAKQQQKTGGGIVAFEVKGGKDAAWRVVTPPA